MKKTFLFALPLLLASCKSTALVSSSVLASSTPVSYNTVTFYRNDGEEGIYLSQIVMENQTLLEPESPKRDGYVFSGWYQDAEGTDSFSGFGKGIAESFPLYASWKEYDSLSSKEKVTLLLSALQGMEGSYVRDATVQLEGKETYAVAPDNPSIYSMKKVYKRYKDITQAEYYNDESILQAKVQFQYDQVHFYNLYQDISGNGKESYKRVAAFKENQIERFLNIGFQNLFCSSLIYYRDTVLSDSYSRKHEETLDFNPTLIHPESGSYSFKFSLQEEFDSTQLGTYVDYVDQLEFGLVFLGGQISRSIVKESYGVYIGGEIQQLSETKQTTSYGTGLEYPDFTSTRFNPDDFPEKK